MNHVSVSPTDGNGPTQGQRKTSHGLLPSDLVAQSVERRRSNPKVGFNSYPAVAVASFLKLPVVLWSTAKRCTEIRAARAARLFFDFYPMKLLCGIVIAVAVVFA